MSRSPDLDWVIGEVLSEIERLEREYPSVPNIIDDYPGYITDAAYAIRKALRLKAGAA